MLLGLLACLPWSASGDSGYKPHWGSSSGGKGEELWVKAVDQPNVVF